MRCGSANEGIPMKKYFFTGLVIFLPAALTLILIIFLFNFFTTPFIPIVSDLMVKIRPHLPFVVPVEFHRFIAKLIALVLLVIFVFVLGAVTRWFLIRHLLLAANIVMERIPFMKTVFKMSRDVLSALFAQDGKKAFKKPVLIPFPNLPDYSIAFVTGEVPEECRIKAKSNLTAVFSPTAPHPISGFLLLVKDEHVHDIDMSNEDAVKFFLSCGIIKPKE